MARHILMTSITVLNANFRHAMKTSDCLDDLLPSEKDQPFLTFTSYRMSSDIGVTS